MTAHQHDSTLVLGAKVGSRVISRLGDLGAAVREGSRGAEPRFAWDDPSRWFDAVHDIGSVFVSFYPDLGFPGAADAIGAFTRCAVEAGVQQFVLLSGRGEPEAARSEQALCDVAPRWTVLRSSWFAQNFSEHFLLEPVLDGVIALPAGNVVEPFIDIDDLADVAVAALTGPGHDRRVYELTGPELLGFDDVARELSAVTERSIMYRPTSAQEYIDGAVAAGIPAIEANELAALFSTVLDGRNAHLTDDMQRVLHRPARSFRDYALRTARTGVWSVASNGATS